MLDLGSNTPAESFAETAQQATRLVAVVVGVTTPGLDEAVRATLAALGEAVPGVPLLAGGSAVGGAGPARELGADAWTGTDGRSVLAAVDAVSRSAEPRQ